MSRRPVIGITIDSSEREGNYESPCTYSTSVEKAGGLPILLPYESDLSLIGQYVDLLDGIVFSGGDDLDPALYGEQRHPKAIAIDPARQNFELALLAEIERRRVPALGICCGSQLMNVYRGGSLIQFLPDEKMPNAIEHRKVGTELKRHPVSIDTHSQLGSAIGREQIQVNTYHKQAVRAIGKGLRVVATAPDGVIEAFEDPAFPLFAAVQWHPERLNNEPEHLAPFQLLVKKAAEAKNR